MSVFQSHVIKCLNQTIFHIKIWQNYVGFSPIVSHILCRSHSDTNLFLHAGIHAKIEPLCPIFTSVLPSVKNICIKTVESEPQYLYPYRYHEIPPTQAERVCDIGIHIKLYNAHFGAQWMVKIHYFKKIIKESIFRKT